MRNTCNQEQPFFLRSELLTRQIRMLYEILNKRSSNEKTQIKAIIKMVYVEKMRTKESERATEIWQKNKDKVSVVTEKEDKEENRQKRKTVRKRGDKRPEIIALGENMRERGAAMVIDTGSVSRTVKIRENRMKRIPKRMELGSVNNM